MKTLNNKTKNILQGLFLLLLISTTTYLVVSSLDFKILSQVIEIIDYKYILLGFALMVFYMILEGYIINLIIESINKTSKKFLGFKIGMIGLFYNLITPMASGSQPMQIYELSKENINSSKATAIVMNKTIIFQIVVTLYCGVFVLLNLNLLQNELKSVFILIAFGLIMNILTLGLGIFIVYNPNIAKTIVNYVINLLVNIQFLGFLKEKHNSINEFIDDYSCSVNMFIKDRKSLLKSLSLTVLQLTIYFSIAFCISKALNISNTSYIYILSLQVFLYMSVSSIPTPGNVGANEVAFFTIFSGIIPKGLLGYSVFLYGIFVYYFLLISCGLFTILNNVLENSKLSFSKSLS